MAKNIKRPPAAKTEQANTVPGVTESGLYIIGMVDGATVLFVSVPLAEILRNPTVIAEKVGGGMQGFISSYLSGALRVTMAQQQPVPGAPGSPGAPSQKERDTAAGD